MDKAGRSVTGSQKTRDRERLGETPYIDRFEPVEYEDANPLSTRKSRSSVNLLLRRIAPYRMHPI